MRYSLSTYRRLVWVQIRSQMQYRASFLIEFLATGLITVLEFASIAVVFDRFGQIRGWSRARSPSSTGWWRSLLG